MTMKDYDDKDFDGVGKKYTTDPPNLRKSSESSKKWFGKDGNNNDNDRCDYFN